MSLLEKEAMESLSSTTRQSVVYQTSTRWSLCSTGAKQKRGTGRKCPLMIRTFQWQRGQSQNRHTHARAFLGAAQREIVPRFTSNLRVRQRQTRGGSCGSTSSNTSGTLVGSLDTPMSKKWKGVQVSKMGDKAARRALYKQIIEEGGGGLCYKPWYWWDQHPS